MKKYKYVINNLDCANCAREIEEYMNSLDDFRMLLLTLIHQELYLKVISVFL